MAGENVMNFHKCHGANIKLVGSHTAEGVYLRAHGLFTMAKPLSKERNLRLKLQGTGVVKMHAVASEQAAVEMLMARKPLPKGCIRLWVSSIMDIEVGMNPDTNKVICRKNSRLKEMEANGKLLIFDIEYGDVSVNAFTGSKKPAFNKALHSSYVKISHQDGISSAQLTCANPSGLCRLMDKNLEAGHLYRLKITRGGSASGPGPYMRVWAAHPNNPQERLSTTFNLDDQGSSTYSQGIFMVRSSETKEFLLPIYVDTNDSTGSRNNREANDQPSMQSLHLTERPGPAGCSLWFELHKVSLRVWRIIEPNRDLQAVLPRALTEHNYEPVQPLQRDSLRRVKPMPLGRYMIRDMDSDATYVYPDGAAQMKHNMLVHPPSQVVHSSSSDTTQGYGDDSSGSFEISSSRLIIPPDDDRDEIHEIEDLKVFLHGATKHKEGSVAKDEAEEETCLKQYATDSQQKRLSCKDGGVCSGGDIPMKGLHPERTESADSCTAVKDLPPSPRDSWTFAKEVCPQGKGWGCPSLGEESLTTVKDITPAVDADSCTSMSKTSSSLSSDPQFLCSGDSLTPVRDLYSQTHTQVLQVLESQGQRDARFLQDSHTAVKEIPPATTDSRTCVKESHTLETHQPLTSSVDTYVNVNVEQNKLADSPDQYGEKQPAIYHKVGSLYRNLNRSSDRLSNVTRDKHLTKLKFLNIFG